MSEPMGSTQRAWARALGGVVWLWVAALLPAMAAAQQPRDYMLTFQKPGTNLLLDYFGTGGVFTLEHRAQIFGASNDLTLAGSVIPAYPLAEYDARADLRILFLGLGGTVGYRTVWRDLTFEPGENGAYCHACDRKSRRDRESFFSATPGSDTYPLAEARATLYFPFNDYLVGTTTGALRYEGRNDRSFDWYYSSIYDRGVMGRYEAQLFLKHPDFGGIGPYVQLLMLPRAGKHEAQWAGGFNMVTRLGLLPRNDLVFLTFLIRPGDAVYGQQSYFAPIRALLIYRIMIDL